jgi:hypothetical protein
MRPLVPRLAALAILILAACGRPAPPASDTAGSAPAAAPEAAPPAFVDEEFERLKATTPVDACAFLPPEKLKAVLPDLAFEVREHVEPRLSGYSWVSRCVYHAGRGSVAMAPNDPTHSVEISVTTAASPEKAAERLAARHDGATTTTGFTPQPALGANAYATSTTGVAMLYFVRDQSEVQINYSDLTTPTDGKVTILLALAGTP